MQILHRLRRILQAELRDLFEDSGSRSGLGGDGAGSGPGQRATGPADGRASGPNRASGPAGGKRTRQRRAPPADPPGVDSKVVDYYMNLELSYGASLQEVRSAYKRLLREYHPDLHHGNPEKQRIAAQITVRLNEAYAYLNNNLKAQH